MMWPWLWKVFDTSALWPWWGLWSAILFRTQTCPGVSQALTWDEEEDSGSEGFVEALEGGVVYEGHDPDDDAEEAGQDGEDHEGPGGVPVGWGHTDGKTLYNRVCVCAHFWKNRVSIHFTTSPISNALLKEQGFNSLYNLTYQ